MDLKDGEDVEKYIHSDFPFYDFLAFSKMDEEEKEEFLEEFSYNQIETEIVKSPEDGLASVMLSGSFNFEQEFFDGDSVVIKLKLEDGEWSLIG